MKVRIFVDGGNGDPQRVCWYVGTSDAMIENAIRMQLHLARSARFLLRDSDGDLVPVSSTLPENQTYQLVEVHDACAPAFPPYPIMQREHSDLQPRPKRRRRQSNGSSAPVATADDLDGAIPHATDGYSDQHAIIPVGANGFSGSPPDTTDSAVLSAIPATAYRPRSVVFLVTRFLETFTRAIPNDDNINFIPSTGAYALYSLYCRLFPDPVHHPKTQSAFYKMTSLQGKVDRQRVIRYYQHSASRATDTTATDVDGIAATSTGPPGGLEFVLYKPEGKGSLLRKYVQIGTDVSAADLVRATSFVVMMDLNPQQIVTEYQRFVEGFQPISKSTFQAHTKNADSVPGND